MTEDSRNTWIQTVRGRVDTRDWGPTDAHAHLVRLVERLVADGLQDRLLLAADHSKNSYWKSYGGGPGFAYILSRFVPRLRQAGIPEPVIQAILKENPARALRNRQDI